MGSASKIQSAELAVAVCSVSEQRQRRHASSSSYFILTRTTGQGVYTQKYAERTLKLSRVKVCAPKIRPYMDTYHIMNSRQNFPMLGLIFYCMVFSFDLKAESEDECLTETGREFQTTGPIY